MSESKTLTFGIRCDRCDAPAREIGYDAACPEAETWAALCRRHASETTLHVPKPTMRLPSDPLLGRV